MQSGTIVPKGTPGFSRLPRQVRAEPELRASVAPADDPRAHCIS